MFSRIASAMTAFLLLSGFVCSSNSELATLLVTAEGPGELTILDDRGILFECSAPCAYSADLPSGTTRRAAATPASEATFVGWSFDNAGVGIPGSITSTEEEIDVVVYELDVTGTATFVETDAETEDCQTADDCVDFCETNCSPPPDGQENHPYCVPTVPSYCYCNSSCPMG